MNGPKAEKDKTEKATGLGRRTRGYRKVGSNWYSGRLDSRQGGDIRNPPASLHYSSTTSKDNMFKITLHCIT